jgi:hypothetical protein
MDISQIQEVIEDRLRSVNTCLPGKIETYDANKREATVAPQLDDKFTDNEINSLPVFTGVPVVQMSTANAGLVLPIAAGDHVLVLFAQRSIDRWLSAGNRGTTGDVRMHAMSDAIAIAGLFPFTVTHTDGSGLLLHNAAIKIRMLNDKIAIGTSLVELLDEVTKALDEIATLSTTWGAVTTQVQASSAAIKTIMGTI